MIPPLTTGRFACPQVWLTGAEKLDRIWLSTIWLSKLKADSAFNPSVKDETSSFILNLLTTLALLQQTTIKGVFSPGKTRHGKRAKPPTPLCGLSRSVSPPAPNHSYILLRKRCCIQFGHPSSFQLIGRAEFCSQRNHAKKGKIYSLNEAKSPFAVSLPTSLPQQHPVVFMKVPFDLSASQIPDLTS